MSDLRDAIEQIKNGIKYKKCWRCGCQQQAVRALEENLSTLAPEDRDALRPLLEEAKATFVPMEYDCLGCKACYPALALNEFSKAYPEVSMEASCGAEAVSLKEVRAGWPPLPGSYTALRYQAPVAVCTLTDEGLYTSLKAGGMTDMAIVGTLQTENLGIERLIINITSNPHIRHLILCGPDTRQAIGHLPGQSLLALAESGLDDKGRIVGAKGHRPVLRNIGRDVVDHFRHTVELVNMIGEARPEPIREAVRTRAARNLGPATPLTPANSVTPIPGYLPERMVSDPAGYFVVYVDATRRTLSLEHYRNDGALDVIVEGKSAAELYVPAVEKNLLTRLDHAAYLGRELAKAERALMTGEIYVQDGAPERKATIDKPSCGCGPSCGEANG